MYSILPHLDKRKGLERIKKNAMTNINFAEDRIAFFQVDFFSISDQMTVTPTARKKKAPTNLVAVRMPQSAEAM